MSKDFPKRNLTTGDIAKLCGVNFRTVIRWIQRGHLKAFQLPGRGDNRVQLQDFLKFLRDNNMPIPEELQVQGRRVLLIEKDAKAAQSMTKALRQSGFEVEIASDGFVAGAMAASFAPSVIVLDPTLPGLGGLAVLDAIRSNPAVPGVKLAVLAGGADGVSVDDARQAGADAVLARPIKGAQLVEAISSITGPTGFGLA